jgi:hypothetical protein
MYKQTQGSINMASKKTKAEKQWQPNPNITPDELTVMGKDVVDKIITARLWLLNRHPFFGNLATRLKIVPADDWCSPLVLQHSVF